MYPMNKPSYDPINLHFNYRKHPFNCNDSTEEIRDKETGLLVNFSSPPSLLTHKPTRGRYPTWQLIQPNPQGMMPKMKPTSWNQVTLEFCVKLSIMIEHNCHCRLMKINHRSKDSKACKRTLDILDIRTEISPHKTHNSPLCYVLLCLNNDLSPMLFCISFFKAHSN